MLLVFVIRFLCRLNYLVLNVQSADSLQEETRASVTRASGDDLVQCSLDQPDQVSAVRSGVHCALMCEQNPDCMRFNIIRGTNLCQMYHSSEGSIFTADQPACLHYKVWYLFLIFETGMKDQLDKAFEFPKPFSPHWRLKRLKCHFLARPFKIFVCPTNRNIWKYHLRILCFRGQEIQ